MSGIQAGHSRVEEVIQVAREVRKPGELMTVADALSWAPQVNAVTLTGMWSKEELIKRIGVLEKRKKYWLL